jgi:2-keto-4-pentenoate hydratase/2-oxohepta-3-ene-1,7-dioic acid hydratase in catechol pathway
MKFITIESDGVQSVGVKLEEGVLDLQKALAIVPHELVPTDTMEIIEKYELIKPIMSSYIENLIQNENIDKARYMLREDQITFGPCVTRPSKIICIGLNYRKHAEETNAPIPKYPILFNKFSNTLTGHDSSIPLPNRVTNQVDYEAELVIVIGKKTKYVTTEQALEHVFGYCNVNDLSARDLQMRTPQWLLGKTCDKFSPLGPYLVTADEVGDPNQLNIQCKVNGEVRQSSNTSDMIFRCDEIVSYISQHMTLYPGDIILTGTPEGVMLGYPEDKRVYLKDGDRVSIEIEGLGKLTNVMINETWPE